ncbi:hypothetical protein E2C01_006009 [Portunus trituberculatus]|uniref:Uncharacterized protein n=1 Tax=Portunus trituberculatus TaxID=210409 RepID=A0A5B7CWQ4_PORTR|nr:hypothetical protein [Portunus trituberculatus]
MFPGAPLVRPVPPIVLLPPPVLPLPPAPSVFPVPPFSVPLGYDVHFPPLVYVREHCYNFRSSHDHILRIIIIRMRDSLSDGRVDSRTALHCRRRHSHRRRQHHQSFESREI